MTYLCTFRIFVHIHSIFMHNVDFKSDTNTLYYIWNLTYLSTKILVHSYTWTHFQFIMQLDVMFCTRSKKIMTYMSTFRVFVHIHTIFMHNVDFKSDTYTLYYIWNLTYLSTKILVHSYTWTHFQFIMQLDVMFCTRSKKIMTYMSTFRIFVHIHTIFMHNVDFKSDTYTLYYIWNLTYLSTKILVHSYTWTHFQFIMQLDVMFCTRSKKIMTYMSTFRIFVHIHTIFMHNVDFKSDTYTLYYVWNLTYLSTKILVHSYTWTHFQFIMQLDVMFCTRSKKIMTYMSTFRIFVHINTIFMHNVDFKSDTYTLYYVWNLTYLSTKILVHSYTWTHFQFIMQLDVMFCTRSKKIMTYMSTFRIFVHIHTIFMHNVDFKSDTYTLYYVWNLTYLSTKILVHSYTWTHFQFIMQLDVMFCTRSKKIMTYMSTFRIFVYIHTIFMHNVDFKSDTYTLYYIWNLTYLCTKILVHSYTWTHFQFIMQLDVMFCTRSKKIMTYMSTFRIFVHIHTIFMHNVDFKSDT